MEKFNIISLETGRVRTKILANSYQDAFNKALDQAVIQVFKRRKMRSKHSYKSYGMVCG